MATYVISDIHGDFKAFENVLKQANFSDKDTLYVLGDIIDRGEDSYKNFDYITKHNNIKMLRGNHECWFLDFWDVVQWAPVNTFKGIYNLARINELNYHYGLTKTITSIAKECGAENVYDVMKNKMIPYFKALPLYYTVEVNGKKYVLVHAGLDFNLDLDKQTQEMVAFNREPFNSLDIQYKDYTIIHGHSTTQFLTNNSVQGDVIFGEHKISIDGGASTWYNGKLNLLRLDDMQIYQTDSKRFLEKDMEK